MKIKLTSVYVDDQEKAVRFYTEVLGFSKKALGADFAMPPTDVTGATIAQANDTCRNLVQIIQPAW